MSQRKAHLERKTKETDIMVDIAVDGNGTSNIDTGIPFFDHMLDLFAKHGKFTVTVKAKGDIDVDYHHTVEDVGITLGQAFDKALNERKGINRYGCAAVPMDESRVEVAVDVGGRPFVVFDVPDADKCIKDIPIQLFEEFFRAFANNCKINIHIRSLYGVNAHHIAESMFKSFARAFDHALQMDNRIEGNIPSTKGVL
ncbi:MAG: imidazoleglycerol-phosphate dehydratase HisB [Candidatus Auribacterota bacterium]|jgi:imidazoleglycerol-phosphate dehydratase|nr:imidazoleglycerol-phosphate dehydratase HisB [Candidatus Auribacterota bacterium]